MKRLAQLFSAIAIAFLGWAVWLIINVEPDRQAVGPHPGGATRPGITTGPVQPPPGPRGPFGLERLPELLDRFDPGVFRPQSEPADPRLTSPVDRILIEKSARRMTVWQQQGLPRTFTIQLGGSPTGDKSRQGDGRTPEGVFRVDRLNPQSRFHLSLGLDYPQKHHRDAARRAGVNPGGDIMIHGQPNSIPDGFRVKGDWTEGCIAVTDPEIEEIFALTRIGTQVEIRP